MTFRLFMLSTAAVGIVFAQSALAEDQAAPAATPAAAPAAPASWASTLKVTGYVEAGVTANAIHNSPGVNFGHLFTDKSNAVLLNQATLTVERDIDSASKTVDFGFKVQGFYGSDARYTHFIGELDRSPTSRNQFDIVEANLQVHLPMIGAGGMDVKLGQYSTPLGVEVISPAGNTFYSHSYIFNFGIPLKHTGILTTTHVNSKLDIYAGYDTGVNTSVGSRGGDQAGKFHFIAGFGLNLKNVTVIALTHIGPELPNGSLGVGVDVSGKYRYLTDANVTWKVTPKLTSITEVNYIKDDGFSASGGGVAQYVTYAFNDHVSAAIRGEVWRDSQGFYVAAFPGNLDFINVETGRANTSYGAGTATYGAVTVGVTFKPAHLPKRLDGLMIRPELRFDTALAGGLPFGGNPGVNKTQFTFGLDLVAPIAF